MWSKKNNLVFLLLLIVIFLALFLAFRFTNKLGPAQTKSNTSNSNPTGISTGFVLLQPKPGSSITGPLVIKGYVPSTWTYEGKFQLELLDSKKKLFYSDTVPTQLNPQNAQKSLYFISAYNFKAPTTSGYLVLKNGGPQNSPSKEEKIEVPIKFLPASSRAVYLFLTSPAEEEKMGNPCLVVIPTQVIIDSQQDLIFNAIKILAHKMNPQFQLLSSNLDKDTLTLEFSNVPGFTSGGACLQQLNRLQIEKTALQFPQVKHVVIAPDSIFQP